MEIEVWENFWSDHQDTDWDLNRPLASVLDKIGVRNKRTLEVGFGSGTTCAFLSRSGAHAVGLDMSKEAVKRARAKGLGFHAALGDCRMLPFADRSFDIVFSQGLLEHFTDPFPLILEQKRVLRPRGALVADVPQKYQLYTRMKHRKIKEGTWPFGWETEYSYFELKRLLEKAGFEVKGSYGNGYYPELFRLVRIAHTIGQTRFKRPIMPKRLGEAYDRFWRRFELSLLACFVLVSVGVWGIKP